MYIYIIKVYYFCNYYDKVIYNIKNNKLFDFREPKPNANVNHLTFIAPIYALKNEVFLSH